MPLQWNKVEIEFNEFITAASLKAAVKAEGETVFLATAHPGVVHYQALFLQAGKMCVVLWIE